MKNSFESPIDHKVLPAKILDYIRDKIISGELKPGEKVSEAKFSEELKISRTPIREAIRLLECEGFIEVIPRRGAVVKSFSSKDINETFEIKACLESFAISSALDNFDDKTIGKLKNFIENEIKYLGKKDISKFFKEFDKFHNLMIEHIENEQLKDLIEKVNKHLLRYRYFALKYFEIIEEIPAYHKELVKKIEKKEKFNFRTFYEKYIKNFAQKLLNYIKI